MPNTKRRGRTGTSIAVGFLLFLLVLAVACSMLDGTHAGPSPWA